MTKEQLTEQARKIAADIHPLNDFIEGQIMEGCLKMASWIFNHPDEFAITPTERTYLFGEVFGQDKYQKIKEL